MYSTDSEEEEEKENGRKTELGRLARRRFQAMLRGLSGRRGELARCMAFSLEHAEAASEVADLIIASLLVDTTPVPRKVSRLHLICDILHNSAIPLPGAWRFRLEFQSRLGLVFDHLSGIYHSFPGRITAETFKNQIIAIVDIWEDWIVFPPEFTSQLRSRLEGQAMLGEEHAKEGKDAKPESVRESAEVSRFKSSSFKLATTLVNPKAAVGVDGDLMDDGNDDDLDGAPVEQDIDGTPLDDVDGAPMDDDVDGLPMDDVDGAPLEDIDGEAIVSDEDLDGAPVAV
jgi:U2-associated protein SR140